MSKQFLKIRSGTSYPGLSADPSDPQNGDLYYNTISNVFRQYLNGSWANVGTSSTSGTVTSVALSVPSFLSVSGSPITSSGTLAVTLSGTALPILNGGTGQTTASAAFNALSPITSTGDLILGTGVNTAGRLGIGSTGDVLTVSGGTAVWAAPAAGTAITALTGDVTASGPGSAAATLATVNSNVGSFGSSTSIPSFTVNGKGLITAASGNAVVAPAGTLSGTTLNATVVSSSLTSVGTITSGTWNGTTIAIANGGTGQTSKTAGFDALSPMTTGGDIIYGGASGTGTRLANGSAGQVLTAAGGTSAPTWATPSSVNQSYLLSNLGFATSVATNALTIALKQADGSTDPAGGGAVQIGFRSSTSGSGAYNLRSVTAASSITIPSGATLGTTSGTTQYIYLYALDNAGTVELAVSSTLFSEGLLQNTTGGGSGSTIVGSANSLSVLYSVTARSGVPIRLIGRLKISETTAGTWASNATVLTVVPFINDMECAAYFAGSNGYGSTNTLIGRIGSGTNTYYGDGKNVVTLADSGTLGSTITLNKTGWYSASLSWSGPGGAAEGVGISLNQSSNTSPITTNDNFLCRYFTGANSMLANVGFTKKLNAGDVLRINVNGGTTQQFPAVCQIIVTFLGELDI